MYFRNLCLLKRNKQTLIQRINYENGIFLNQGCIHYKLIQIYKHTDKNILFWILSSFSYKLELQTGLQVLYPKGDGGLGS
jgi:hypothetical protein